MGAMDISLGALAGCYLLILIPLAAALWLGAPLVRSTLSAVVRMTVQLAFVGLYLGVIFQYDNIWLTSAWMIVMVIVADASIIRGCALRLRLFAVPLAAALVAGTAIPLCYFVGVLLRQDNLLAAQYAIPIGGMILGNCLRANIIGIRGFYDAIRKDDRAYGYALALGASLHEATRPYWRDAFRDAVSPTIATMATIGVVSLPGMMTGVVLGGTEPATAVKYQIAIMVAIFSGTAITVMAGIWLTMHRAFDGYGLLRTDIFSEKS